MKPEDIIKVLSNLMDYGQLREDLREQLMNSVDNNISNFDYDKLAELAIIFATKFDQTHKEIFFEKFMPKLVQMVEHFKEDTLYKMLWSFIKSGRLTTERDALLWVMVKQGLQKRVADLSSKVLCDILIISTACKEADKAIQENFGKDYNSLDLWDTIEPIITMKMRDMKLPDLINLLWCASELKKGSDPFLKELEKNLTRLILKVGDDDFEQLLTCFTREESNPLKDSKFAKNLLQMVLSVLEKKKDRFQLRTLVSIGWQLSKLEFSATEQVIEALNGIRDYERMHEGLESLSQKN